MGKTLSIVDKRAVWFDEFVAQLRADELSLESGTAAKDVAKFYDTAISGDMEEIAGMVRLTVDKKNVMSLISKYARLLSELGQKPNQLAVNLFNNKVLIWVEIRDDNEEMEKALLRIEAKLNAEFYDRGYRLSTTIVEKGDEIPVPDHYHNMMDIYA